MGQADITNAMENLSSSSAGSGMGSLGGLFLALKSVSCASTLSALPMFLFDDDDDDDEENKDGSRKELLNCFFLSLSLQLKCILMKNNTILEEDAKIQIFFPLIRHYTFPSMWIRRAASLHC